MSHMVDLIFSKDTTDEKDLDQKGISSTHAEIEIKEEFKNPNL